MADRIVETTSSEVPEMPEILEKVLLFALAEGKEKMVAGQDIIPFTALVVKDNLFLETHPGDSAEECFAVAQHTVQGARGADAYAFCYDGYIDTDDGMKDAIIAEGGVPGADKGHAISFLYSDEDGQLSFEEEPAYVGEAPNFMIALKDASEYRESEIEERYLDDDEADPTAEE